MTVEHQRYIAGIDGLRALAVLAVIIYHFHPAALPGGFSGVDVFLVISGYVVTGSLLSHSDQSTSGFFAGFYARRMLRIYPALLVCLLVTSLFKIWFVPLAWLSYSVDKTGLYAFLGLSNVALIVHNDGYFSPRVEMNPFTHTWSLGVEEQFYLLFPLVLYVWSKSRRQPVAWSRAVKALPAMLLVASLVVCWWQSQHQPDMAYYLLPSRYWELASGASLCLWHAARKQQSTRLQTIALMPTGLTSWLGMGLLLSGFVLSDPTAFPMPWALVSVAGTLLLIHGLASLTHADQALQGMSLWLSRPTLVYIGKLSYSLYLWHWPVIVLLRWTTGDTSMWVMLFAWVVTFFLALLSYHLIERRCHYARLHAHVGNTRILGLGGVAVVGCLLLTWWGFKQNDALTLSVTGQRETWHPPLLMAQPEASRALHPRPPHLFVMGDSHVGAYAGMLNRLSREQGWVVSPQFKGGCAVADLLQPASQTCQPHVQSVVEDVLRQAQPGDWVFLVSLRMNRLVDQWQLLSEHQIEQAQRISHTNAHAALKEANDLITRLEAAGLRVIIDAPKPVFRSPPFRCSDWFNAQHDICTAGFKVSQQYLQAHRSVVMQSIDTLKQGHPRLQVWDAFPHLCGQTYCSAFHEGQPLFFDGDHLSGYGNQYLYPHFLKFLKQVESTI